MTHNTLRSLLFVPGSRPERFVKALAAGADMICIDLEDAVLPSDKESARKAVAEFILSSNSIEKICVRVNPVDSPIGWADLEALAEACPAAIMIAKCSCPTDVKTVEQLVNKHVSIIPLIESIQGLDNICGITTASDSVKSIMFGGADMSAELRCDFSYEPLLFVRSQLALAAARANIDLIDVPYVNIKDEQGLIDETEKVKALGFNAKAAIHPCQINGIHQAFSPTEEQISYAKAVLDAVDNPDAGAVVVQGRMVDRPIILASQRIMALANQSIPK